MAEFNTTNLNLKVLDKNDYATELAVPVLENTWDKDTGNFKVIDDAMGGTPASLSTTAKTIIPAINELDTNIGDLSTLNTASKTDLVGSNNEINGCQGY
jgi:hypothetical protein